MTVGKEARLTISSHSSERSSLLKHLDDLVFVLGEDFGKTIGAIDKVMLQAAGQPAVEKLVCVVDLGAETQHLAGFLRDSNSVTSKHLDRHA